MPEFAEVLEFLVVGLASGGIAGFFLKTDLSISWIATAGLVGVALEPWVPFAWGPTLFGHCLLISIAASMAAIFVFWLLRLLGRSML